MYRRFFGLREIPFTSSPDPRFLHMMPQTREALACLQYGIGSRKGFMALTGEVGTGKTTLLNAVMRAFKKDQLATSFVFNPRMEVLDFFEFVLTDFGIRVANKTKSGMLIQLNRWLVERYRQNGICAIVIDEAQNLTWELLEEIRMLTNLETENAKLVQVILSGQPELEHRMRQPDLRQLRQRIVLWPKTRALTNAETVGYIAERLRIAGATEPVFAEGVPERIFELSQGIPRTINLLCERSLLDSFAQDTKPVPLSVVNSVADDLGLPATDLSAAKNVTSASRSVGDSAVAVKA